MELKKHINNRNIQYQSFQAAVGNLKGTKLFCRSNWVKTILANILKSKHCKQELCTHKKNERHAKPTVTSVCSISENNSHNPVHLDTASFSTSDEDPLKNCVQSSVSNVKEKQLIEKENVHPSKISEVVWSFFYQRKSLHMPKQRFMKLIKKEKLRSCFITI